MYYCVAPLCDSVDIKHTVVKAVDPATNTDDFELVPLCPKCELEAQQFGIPVVDISFALKLIAEHERNDIRNRFFQNFLKKQGGENRL